MIAYSSPNTEENEDVNAPKYLVEILNTHSHPSAFSDNVLSLNTIVIVMLLFYHRSYEQAFEWNKIIWRKMTNNMLFFRNAWKVQRCYTDSSTNQLWTYRSLIPITMLQASPLPILRFHWDSNKQGARAAFSVQSWKLTILKTASHLASCMSRCFKLFILPKL